MTTASVLEPLSCRDKLLFSQAIYEFGADSWAKVSEVLLSHPLIQLPRETLAPESVANIYRALAADMPDTTDGRGNADAAKKPYARFHLRIAQKHYTARVQELRTSIKANEEEFERITKEIEELRAGEWDDKIATRLREKKLTLENLEKLAIIDKSAELMDLPKAVDDKLGAVEAIIPDGVPSQDVDEDTVESHTALQVETDSIGQGKTSVAPSPVEKEDPMHEKLRIAAEEQASPTAIPANGDTSLSTVAALSNEDAQQAVSPTGDAPSPDHRQPLEKGKKDRPTRRTRNKSKSPSPMSADDDDAMDISSELPSSAAGKSDEPEHAHAEEKTVDAGEEDSMQVDESAATEVEIGTPQKALSARMETTDSPPTAAATPAPETGKTGPRTGRRGKRKTMDVDDRAPPFRSVKRLRENSENVDTADEDEVSTPQRKDFKRFIAMLHTEISSHRSGNLFQRPVKTNYAPNYHDIIKRPMDLKTIRARFNKTGEITNVHEYHRDLSLMFCNALMFNRPGSDVYTIAHSMMSECEQQVQDFFQTHR